MKGIREFILIVLGMVSLFIIVNAKIQTDYKKITIGSGNKLSIDMNIEETKKLVPKGVISYPEIQTDYYKFNFKIKWISNNQKTNKLTGILNVQLKILIEKDNNYLIDERLDKWIGFEVDGGYEIRINRYKDIEVLVYIIEPTIDEQTDMIGLLAGAKLTVNFTFSVT